MPKNTSISLGEHFDGFTSKQIKSGKYGSVNEVVRDGLRLLDEQEQPRAALRKALIAGEKSGIAGPLDIDRIKQNAREQLQVKRKRA